MADHDTTDVASFYESILSQHVPDLRPYEDLYKQIHANGELSMQESETAKAIKKQLQSISPDFDIKTSIGGHGLVAVFRNQGNESESTDSSKTKTVLLRADMDALPISEETNLDYASTRTMKDTDGVEKPVMHACGHDLHVTTLLAAAAVLSASRSRWRGTVIFLFQPGEERALGARAMVDDGLYDTKRHACPIPDVVLGQHVLPFRAGTVATRYGSPMSAADSFEITVFGRGGHASMPHLTVDPVVIACHIVVRWQTIISREVPPSEIAVLTVGSIQSSSTTEDVISDKATLKVNIRTVTKEWRRQILESMKRVARLEAEIAKCPREPKFQHTSQFPLTVNDNANMDIIRDAFSAHFGDKHNPNMGNALASEDFSILATAVERPCCYWFYGGIAEDVWAEHEEKGTTGEIPGNHSPMFAPAIQPSMRTGVEAMVVAALAVLASQ